MNYLAHCLLSCSEEDILIGNFMTDFLRKKEEPQYEGRILEGIGLHRKIDQYTDSHPASLALRAMLRPRHGKYASVVVDLIWDYFLSKDWANYSSESLNDFALRVYDILSSRKSELPSRLQERLDGMIRGDFLKAYATRKNMEKSLAWMDNRVNFKSAFSEAVHDLDENTEAMQVLFDDFFPDLLQMAEQQCSC